jgi:hypothetical protein
MPLGTSFLIGPTKHEKRKVRNKSLYSCFRGFVLCCSTAVVLPAGFAHAQGDPPRSPLITWEDLLPARRGAVLWVRNPTADTVWLDSLHVESCLNIRRGGCGTRPLGLVLAPGASRKLHRLEPAVPQDAFSYQWFLDWKTAKVDSIPPRLRKPKRDNSPVIRT